MRHSASFWVFVCVSPFSSHSVGWGYHHSIYEKLKFRMRACPGSHREVVKKGLKLLSKYKDGVIVTILAYSWKEPSG